MAMERARWRLAIKNEVRLNIFIYIFLSKFTQFVRDRYHKMNMRDVVDAALYTFHTYLLSVF